ncbi:hypothetical protein FHG87_000400 [Trinorchestia longiramus]|nr:hypothetical protein FHG87_000400 [Trinorchestia longiramus]
MSHLPSQRPLHQRPLVAVPNFCSSTKCARANGTRKVAVASSGSATVAGSSSTTVAGSGSSTVAGSSNTTVAGSGSATVAGSSNTTVACSGSATVACSGSATVACSGSATVACSGSATVACSGSATVAGSGSATVACSGSTTVAGSGSARMCKFRMKAPVTTGRIYSEFGAQALSNRATPKWFKKFLQRMDHLKIASDVGGKVDDEVLRWRLGWEADRRREAV